MVDCVICDGKGGYLVQRGRADLGDEPTRETCYKCHGSGQLSELAAAVERARHPGPPPWPVRFETLVPLVPNADATTDLHEACKKVILLWDWVTEAGGTDGALPQAMIDEFVKMQMEVRTFLEAAIQKAEWCELKKRLFGEGSK